MVPSELQCQLSLMLQYANLNDRKLVANLILAYVLFICLAEMMGFATLVVKLRMLHCILQSFGSVLEKCFLTGGKEIAMCS